MVIFFVLKTQECLNCFTHSGSDLISIFLDIVDKVNVLKRIKTDIISEIPHIVSSPVDLCSAILCATIIEEYDLRLFNITDPEHVYQMHGFILTEDNNVDPN